jgi:hypothetical protein
MDWLLRSAPREAGQQRSSAPALRPVNEGERAHIGAAQTTQKRFRFGGGHASVPRVAPPERGLPHGFEHQTCRG